MLSSIASSNAAQSAPQASAISSSTASGKPAATKPQAVKNVKDTVQLSSTAQAALAAIQEGRETPAQTAKEAGGGDLQAQRLLARQQAAIKAAHR
jgi:hypothetical protein